jgi:pheromone shutdown protein TraB
MRFITSRYSILLIKEMSKPQIRIRCQRRRHAGTSYWTCFGSARQLIVHSDLADKIKFPLVRFEIGSVDIYLLGTSHVSRRAADDASFLLDAIQPTAVVLELCVERYQQLLQQESETKTLFLLARQRRFMTGGEFVAATRHIQSRDSKPLVVLGDLPIAITMERTVKGRMWKLLALDFQMIFGSSRKKLLSTRTQQQLERGGYLKLIKRAALEGDLEAISACNEIYALEDNEITRTSDRDEWMTAKLVQVCQDMTRREERHSMVAIVGAGHMEGMMKLLMEKDPLHRTCEEVLRRLLFQGTTDLSKNRSNEELEGLVTNLFFANTLKNERAVGKSWFFGDV